MLFKWENFDGSHVVSVAESQNWSLHALHNIFNHAYLCLRVGAKEYEVYCSIEYSTGYDNLSDSSVADLYRHIIDVAYGQIQSENRNAVNLDAIKNTLLPEYWQKWIDEGEIDN